MIKQYYQQLTSNDPVVHESPSLVVLNGSGITGLAHKESLILQAKGFNVVGALDANSLYPSSLIVDLSNNQKPASKKLLQTILNRDTTTTTTLTGQQALEAKNYQANFVIVLGKSADNTQLP
ncbi:MAG: hypothetical protein NVS1B10_07070 [Candidatus Saccharimonadales bacterium]